MRRKFFLGLAVLFFSAITLIAPRNVFALCGSISSDPPQATVPFGTAITFTLMNCELSASSYSIQIGAQTYQATALSSTQYSVTVPSPQVGNYVVSIIENNNGNSVAISTATLNISNQNQPPGGGGAAAPANNTAELVQCDDQEGTINTAIGCIPIGDVNQMARFFLGWGLGIAGGVALLMIGFASFRIMTSQGDPRRLQGGQELLLSALGGLLMVILSVYLLRFVGVDLLGIF